MITLRKFLSLPRGVRLRKTLRLLRQWGRNPEDPLLMKQFLEVLLSDNLPLPAETLLRGLLADMVASPREAILWNLNAFMYCLMRELGLEAADWDFDPRPSAGAADQIPLSGRVYIDGIRSAFNIGSVFRSSECFGVREILIEPGSASPRQPRAQRSAMGCVELVPWRFADYREVENADGLFALELGGTSLSRFEFPENGVCVIGSEELGVSPRLREAAKKRAGIVSIPLAGGKASLNVSVAFGILLYAWRARSLPA